MHREMRNGSENVGFDDSGHTSTLVHEYSVERNAMSSTCGQRCNGKLHVTHICQQDSSGVDRAHVSCGHNYDMTTSNSRMPSRFPGPVEHDAPRVYCRIRTKDAECRNESTVEEYSTVMCFWMRVAAQAIGGPQE